MTHDLWFGHPYKEIATPICRRCHKTMTLDTWARQEECVMGKNHTEVCPSCMRADRDCECVKFCFECRCWTNHTTREHCEAEAEMEREG